MSDLMNLWLPSMCQRLFGPATEYCLRMCTRERMALSAAPPGSTLVWESRTLCRVSNTPCASNLNNQYIYWNYSYARNSDGISKGGSFYWWQYSMFSADLYFQSIHVRHNNVKEEKHGEKELGNALHYLTAFVVKHHSLLISMYG